MGKVKYIYWGGFNSGKRHLRLLFKYNSKTSASISERGVVVFKVGNPNSITEAEGVDYLFSQKGPQQNICKDDFVEHDRSQLNIYQYENIDLFLDCGLLLDIPSHVFTNYTSSFYKLKTFAFQPTHNDVIVDHVRMRKNIFPYKTDLLDCLKSRLLLYKFDGDDFLEFLDLNQTEIYAYLDDNIRQSRLIEQTLLKYGINFDYFDLDHDDYLTTFDLQKDLPRDQTKVKVTEDAPIGAIDEFINQYIETKKITDMRIQGISTDGLSYAKQ